MFNFGTQTGYKNIQFPFFTASLLPLNDLLKEKKAVNKENLISLEIDLANLKLDIEEG